MISTGEIVLERIEYALGEREVDNEGRLSRAAIEATGFKKRYEAAPGTGVFELAMSAAAKIPADAIAGTGGVVAATFSYADRFPSLAVRIGSALGMDPSAPMLDLQMACSAYPYALYVAGCLCAATGKKILVVSAHLHYGGTGAGHEEDDKLRRYEIRALLAWLETQRATYPDQIVMGDMNSHYKGGQGKVNMTVFEDGGFEMTCKEANVKGDVGGTIVKSSRSVREEYVFDYILTKGKIDAAYYTVVDNPIDTDGKYPSDHIPIMAKIIFR